MSRAWLAVDEVVDDLQMISSELPAVLAKATEIFAEELSLTPEDAAAQRRRAGRWSQRAPGLPHRHPVDDLERRQPVASHRRTRAISRRRCRSVGRCSSTTIALQKTISCYSTSLAINVEQKGDGAGR